MAKKIPPQLQKKIDAAKKAIGTKKGVIPPKKKK
jgi:hypothetical protein